MTMRVPYKLLPVRLPVVSLGGRRVRPRPLVFVTLVGPSGVFMGHAMLDTAADDTVFPDAAAAAAGLDLSNAPSARRLASAARRSWFATPSPSCG